MKKPFVFWMIWVIYTGSALYRYPPWEHDWHNSWLGIIFVGLIAIWMHGFEFLGQRLGVGEARFDPETDKLRDEEVRQ